MKIPSILAVIAAVSAAAGAAAALWLSSDAEPAPRAEIPGNPEVAELRERVDELEQLLQSVLASVDSGSSPQSGDAQIQPEAAAPQPSPATAEDRATSWRRSQERREQRERTQLAEAGWTEPEIDELQRLRESAQLQRLEQQHLAAREIRTKYPEAAQLMQLRDPLRDALGDEKYGAYLEAVGRPSAVRVSRVVPGSAGETAGLREGDMIRGYAGERVFSRNDLEQASLSGDYGEPVTLEVLRDGATFYLTIPRGPIGTSLWMRD